MTDLDLFRAAEECAQRRQRWIDRAAGLLPSEKTRRQCLHQARKCELSIVDLAILAELRCEREASRRAWRLAAGTAA